jgi:hypothetical protein
MNDPGRWRLELVLPHHPCQPPSEVKQAEDGPPKTSMAAARVRKRSRAKPTSGVAQAPNCLSGDPNHKGRCFRPRGLVPASYDDYEEQDALNRRSQAQAEATSKRQKRLAFLYVDVAPAPHAE